jgi:hypothetical protein
MARIKPRRIAELSLPTDEQELRQVRVLARWNDPRHSPAVVEKRIGRGYVLLWTISADRAWSDWPAEPSYVLAARQTTMSVVARSSDRNNVTAGAALNAPLDKQALPSGATLTIPGQEPHEVLPVDMSIPDAPQLSYERTRRAGVYEMRWQDPILGDLTQLFAVSPDVRESNLAPLSESQLSSFLGAVNPSVTRFGGDAMNLSAGAAELWRSAVFVLLVLVVLESSLAAWVGREQ